MEIPQLFLESYDVLRRWMEQATTPPTEQGRARPHGLNSIAWLIWHMARVEDSGLNRLVFDRPQVLDDPPAGWMERMHIPLRHHGTTMTSAEVDELTAQADIEAVWAYSTAVAERTHELVAGLRPAMLDGLVEPGHLRQVLFAEGMLRPQHAWPTDPPPYGLASKGRLLMQAPG